MEDFYDGIGDDMSEYDGEDCLYDGFDNDEPRDQFRDDVEADADVLASAGWGTDEDYGFYGDDGYDSF